MCVTLPRSGHLSCVHLLNVCNISANRFGGWGEDSRATALKLSRKMVAYVIPSVLNLPVSMVK
jgi:hypothetical protein